MESKLNISFLWHQHQPFYKTLTPDGKSLFRMPWVRLHAVKDYYDLPRWMEDFPEVRQNFNLVPSLLAQIEDYVENRAVDRVLELTAIRSSELSEHEKEEILRSFFMANQKRLIAPHPRYLELWQKKENKAAFSLQDFTDLQVWYNLCWVGEYWKKQEPFASLIGKGKYFNEADKQSLIDGHYRIMGSVIPLYQKLVKEKRIELSVTPYYHPILPLLCNSDVAKGDASVGFRHPEDAAVQIRRSAAYFERLFGFKPSGMWPSEGSVSEEAVALMADAGITWIATDQEILECSDTEPASKEIGLPYRCSGLTEPFHMVFRDHALSDAIGFVYAEMDPQKAADDFIARAENVRRRIIEQKGKPGDFLLNVVLDGENCWEFYPENGAPFLRALYLRLTESKTLCSVTIGEFLKRPRPDSFAFPKITRLHAGSWIQHNFDIWIGSHKEKNTAWQYLKKTRDYLESSAGRVSDAKTLEAAWEEIYIAEGSDWFWWFGDDHQAENKSEFDSLFRYHLIRVYDLTGEAPPSYLTRPIMSPKTGGALVREPTALIRPKIDGRVTHFYEWSDAGLYEAQMDGDTMHLSERWIKTIRYGFDETSVYFRIDFFEKACEKFRTDPVYSVRFEFGNSVFLTVGSEGFRQADNRCQSRFDAILEVKIPFEMLGLKAQEKLELTVAVREREREIVRRPSRKPLIIAIPDEASDKYVWSV